MIRKAESTDYQSILSMHRKLYELHHEKVPQVFKRPTNESPETKLEVDLEKTLVYVDSNDVVGFLSYGFHEVEESEELFRRHMLVVFDVFVETSARRGGIGKKLIAAAENVAFLSGCDSVEIPVYSFNEDAFRFYETGGFREYVRRFRKKLEE